MREGLAVGNMCDERLQKMPVYTLKTLSESGIVLSSIEIYGADDLSVVSWASATSARRRFEVLCGDVRIGWGQARVRDCGSVGWLSADKTLTFETDPDFIAALSRRHGG